MTTRELRREMTDIDGRLGLLEPHIVELEGARRKYLLEGDASTVEDIERGLGRDEGVPNDPALAGFTRGLPGLRRSRAEAETLRERRALLEAKLPTAEDVEKARAAATGLANGIKERMTRSTKRAKAIESKIAELVRLVVENADDLRRASVESGELDRLCADADIERPQTPSADSPMVNGAVVLARLLSVHCVGGRAVEIDPGLRRQLEAA
jgi:hypothetical protein